MTGRQHLGVVATIIAIAVIGVIAAHHFLGDELSPLGAGTTAPNFSAMTIDAPVRRKQMTDYQHRVVLLNVWATWCVPCRAEMPGMQRLHEQYAAKGLDVVAVSIDEPGTEPGIHTFAKELGLTFEILHDATGSIQRAYQTTGVPESVLIGKDGIIRKKIAGAIDWSSSDNRTLVEQLLAE